MFLISLKISYRVLLRNFLSHTMNLKNYPDFEPLSSTHGSTLKNFTQNFPPYSDFNFTSLFSYNTDSTVAVSNLHGNLVVRFSDYITNEPFYSFIGDQKIPETTKILLEKMKIEGLNPVIKLVPEYVVEKIDSDLFSIKEDEDNHDYILSVEQTQFYKGSSLKTHRNSVSRFLREHNPEIKTLDLSDIGTHNEIKQFFLTWVDIKGIPFSDAENEFMAVSNFLKLPIDNFIGVGVYMDGVLSGFALCETLNKNYSMIHFEKADSKQFIGIYQYLMKETARILSEGGYKMINYQQDLGMLGLKKSKKSFSPMFYLKKFCISWR